MANEVHDLTEPLLALFEKLGLDVNDVYKTDIGVGRITVYSYVGRRIPDGQADLEHRIQTFRYRLKEHP